MRAGVMANARSRICFQLAQDDAKTLAASSTILGTEDFTSLGAYQFYGQLVAGGAVQPWCSGQSLAPSPATGDEAALRAASRQRYGIPVADIDAALEQLVTPKRQSTRHPANDLAPKRRRTSGGSS